MFVNTTHESVHEQFVHTLVREGAEANYVTM